MSALPSSCPERGTSTYSMNYLKVMMMHRGMDEYVDKLVDGWMDCD
jgi:hypothetical protein